MQTSSVHTRREAGSFNQLWQRAGETQPSATAPKPPFQEKGTVTADGECLGRAPGHYWKLETRAEKDACLVRAFGPGSYLVKKVEGKGWQCFRISSHGPTVHVETRPDVPHFPLPNYLTDAVAMAERYLNLALGIVKEKGNVRLQAKIGDAMTAVEAVLAEGGAR